MKISYLDSTKPDLAWFRLYYEGVFPAGALHASKQYARTVAILMSNPLVGRPTSDPAIRRYPIRKTPFAICYRVNGDTIEVVRIWDQRADPEKLGFHEEAAAYA